MNAAELQQLFLALEGAGFDVPREHRSGFVDALGPFHKAKVTRFIDQHVWSTDLFVVEGEFLQSALSRARVAMIEGVPCRVMAPEDVIVLKLIANRRKDLADVEEIVTICESLDWDYLQKWASAMRINDRLKPFHPPK